MRSKHFISILMLVFCLGLQSCATVKDAVNPYDENFHCRAKDTEGKCTDTPGAYVDARQGPQTMGQAYSTSNIRQEAKDSQYRAIAGLLDEPKAPLLKPPKILRILILPYRGERNELFMSRYAYLEVEKPSWVLTDINEKEK